MKKKVRRLLSFLLIFAMIFSLAPTNAFAWNGGSSGGGHNETDAYFYVLKPDYNGTLEDATQGHFFYVGLGSVSNDVAEISDYTGNIVNEYIESRPSTGFYDFLELGITDTSYGEYINLVGDDFSNVIWYRTVLSDGANSNGNTPIVESGTACWHVDGTARPIDQTYQVKFWVDFLENQPLVAQYSNHTGTEIQETDIEEATKEANKEAPAGYHIEWLFDEECVGQPASTQNIITTSGNQGNGDILYIYGKYVENTKYNVTYEFVASDSSELPEGVTKQLPSSSKAYNGADVAPSKSDFTPVAETKADGT
ncbi:MAG: hypothetical protein UDG94_00010, partial [Peptococcaceae bacterium]|nr:hypothetical protein [Peptococcaceae bacterium]